LNFLITKILPETLSSGEKFIRNISALNKLSANKNKKCILLKAPKGSGKSSLLSEFIKNSEIKFSYYKLDSEDDNLFIFLSCLIDSVNISLEGFKEELQEQLKFYKSKFIRKEIANKSGIINFAKSFLNNLFLKSPSDFYIIIDNSEYISAFDWAHTFFDYIIENSPNKIHFIFTTAYKYPFDEFNIGIKRNCIELVPADFKAAAAMVKDIAKELYEMDISAERAALISSKTNGWMTGVHILLQSLMKDDELSFDKDIGEMLHNFFDKQVIANLNKNICGLLFLAANFESFTPQLLKHISKSAHVNSFFEIIRGEYGFLIEETGNEKFRYLDFFKSYLLKARPSVNEKELKQIYNEAADYFLKAGEYESAVKYFIMSGDYKSLFPLLSKKIPELIKNGDLFIVDKWLALLDEDVFEKNPMLEYYRALNHKHFYLDFQTAEQCFNKFLKSKSITEEFEVKAICHIAEMKLVSGDKQKAKTILEAQRKKIKKDNNLPELLFRLSTCYTSIYNFDKAQNCALESLEILGSAKSSEKNSVKASVLNEIGNIKHYLGEFSEAKKYYKKCLGIIENPYHKIQTEINYLLVSINAGDFTEAADVFRELESIKILKQVPELRILQKITSINYYFELSDFKKCLSEFDLIRGLCDEFNSPAALVTASIIKLKVLFFLDDLTGMKAALNSIEKNLSSCAENEKYYADLFKAIVKNDIQSAQKISDYFSGNKLTVDYIYSLFYLSYLEMKKKNNKSSMKYFAEALDISLKEQFSNIAAQMFVFKRELFDLALKENTDLDVITGISAEVVKRIEQENLFADELSVTDIYVSYFGLPEIYIRGEKVNDKDWKRNKFKQIFLYLFMNRNSFITKDILINEFFPDSDTAYTDNIFHQFLSVLRGILNKHNEYYKYENKVFYFNAGFIYNSDLEKLKSYYKKSSAFKTDNDSKRKQLEKGISLCNDIFMKGYYETWVEDARTEANAVKTKMIKELIAILKSRSETEEAIKYYSMLLSDDELNEEFHYEIISLHMERGDVNSAKLKYKFMLEKFDKELGEKPSAQFLTRIKNVLLN